MAGAAAARPDWTRTSRVFVRPKEGLRLAKLKAFAMFGAAAARRD